ncbi:MAG: serine/threonine-protein kinase [Planctomycetota bacterium]|nr:serine/threonine-protein kinase [Planctomycetota bacterium]
MQVIISITTGPFKGKTFVFEKPDCLLFGRAPDATIAMPDDHFLSRHHFLLRIAPPDCTVTDLDSKNGTMVNGVRYGGRKEAAPGVKCAPPGVKEVALRNNDTISVGKTTLCLTIQPAPAGAKPAQPAAAQAAPRPVLCANCGREVTAEAGVRGQAANAEYICRQCREAQLAAPPAQAPAAGDQESADKKLAGKPPAIPGYSVDREVGRGGMGIVYCGTELATGRQVAIKTMLPTVAAEAEHVRSFMREIEVNRQLDHRNIVKFISHGYSQGVFYFILEFVDGMDLDDFAGYYGGTVPLEVAAPLMLGALDGLAHAHRARIKAAVAGEPSQFFTGVVHRDIKPANILLARDGKRFVPKVADFGLAKSFEAAGFTNMTADDMTCGTPSYWPREQITHYRYLHPASDVFSIAAVYYELLTGRRIRAGLERLYEDCRKNHTKPRLADLVVAIMTDPVRKVREVSRDVPGPLAAVLERALSEQEMPAETDTTGMRARLEKLRYRDAAEFREALAGALRRSGVAV